MSEEQQKKTPWKLIINVVTFLALAGLFYVTRDQIGETVSNVGNLKKFALFLMVPAQILNYHAYSQMYQDLFYILNKRIRYLKMFRVQLELNFVNTVFPSGGVTGVSYFGVRMKSMGVSGGQSTLVQFMKYILVFISFQILLAAGLIILAIGGQASNLAILVAGSLATLLFIGSFIGAYILGSKQRINSFFTFLTNILNRLIHVFRRRHPETISVQTVQDLFTDLHENYMLIRKNPKVLKRPLVSALLANIAEIITIYIVYIAFAQWVNPGAVIIAYAVANFAGVISVFPGGVGVYEFLMTGVLASAGVPAGVSLPITITYRIINMTIQLPPGYYFYHKAIHDKNYNQ
ncbi:MAG TPA: lysylphosphatidylglycerol synthase transmembrane domain-containing protein [Candidatus Saccharibacteria bacterium]|nr:lysylphosphatidylglycerol synthase transmembrane domain-containing protein [Candidatus Saccharibacteria bacterium]